MWENIYHYSWFRNTHMKIWREPHPHYTPENELRDLLREQACDILFADWITMYMWFFRNAFHPVKRGKRMGRKKMGCVVDKRVPFAWVGTGMRLWLNVFIFQGRFNGKIMYSPGNTEQSTLWVCVTRWMTTKVLHRASDNDDSIQEGRKTARTVWAYTSAHNWDIN